MAKQLWIENKIHLWKRPLEQASFSCSEEMVEKCSSAFFEKVHRLLTVFYINNIERLTDDFQGRAEAIGDVEDGSAAV